MVLAEGKVEKREKKVTHGDLVTIMMECILKRGSSYSTILLSDALKKLVTPSLSVILLRVVSLFLRGLCAPLGIRFGLGEIGNDANDLVNIFTSTGTYIGGVHNTYGDEHIQRAITWAEALLDSHFSALTFRASFHAPTRQALGCVMDAGKQQRIIYIYCTTLLFYLSHFPKFNLRMYLLSTQTTD